MVPASVHAGHFFGLHLPSLVAPHFSHLNTAILFSFVSVFKDFRGLPHNFIYLKMVKIKVSLQAVPQNIIMQADFDNYLIIFLTCLRAA